MTLLDNKSPLSKSKLPGKRLCDEDGGCQDFSTNIKRTKYSDHIPGFHDTGYMKVRSERPVVRVTHSRMLKQNTSFEMKKLRNLDEGSSKLVGKTCSAKKQENGSLHEQSDGLVSQRSVPQLRAFGLKCSSVKNQPSAPSAQLAEIRGFNVRSERAGGSDNPSRLIPLNDSNESRKSKNVNLIAESSLSGNAVVKGKICYTLHKQSHSLVSGKTLSQQLPGRRFGDDLDEMGCASQRKFKEIPFKEHAEARPRYAEATNHLAGEYYFPAKESNSPSSFQTQAAISRDKVITTLRLFDKIYEEERKEKLKGLGIASEKVSKIATDIIKQKIKWVNRDEVGAVCGIEIGDQFRFKGQLLLVGLHYQYNRGISYIKEGQKSLATSIVDSNRYTKKLVNDPQRILFSGHGGNPFCSQKKVEDQKLKRGNLALRNSMDAATPVRVIRKHHITVASKKVPVFVYDGLYIVCKCTQERGQFGKQIYMFELKRIAGQRKLIGSYDDRVKEIEKRHAFRVGNDISQGLEMIPIYAFNDLDYEKPPRFSYTTKIIYPDRYKTSMITSSFGCDCVGGCLDSGGCTCVAKNGGAIPFNENGTLLHFKPTVYECGPSCKCPPSCKNRVSQHGVRYQFEIFKTESSGWGVRSRNFIAKGSFICEYAGVLLPYEEVRELGNRREYGYVIGDDHEHTSLSSSCFKTTNNDGFAIDAREYGNIGRFINHSCSVPNLFAQSVLFDHDDKRMPHVMLFASKDIPPNREFTFDHYLCLS